jgi:hypothetical protein
MIKNILKYLVSTLPLITAILLLSLNLDITIIIFILMIFVVIPAAYQIFKLALLLYKYLKDKPDLKNVDSSLSNLIFDFSFRLFLFVIYILILIQVIKIIT